MPLILLHRDRRIAPRCSILPFLAPGVLTPSAFASNDADRPIPAFAGPTPGVLREISIPKVFRIARRRRMT
jgi:hypothetical protein